MVTTRDNTIESLREEQSYAEAESPQPREMSKVVDNRSDDSRVDSQRERSNVTSTVTPRATDITLVEEQPAFKTAEPKFEESDGSARDVSIREPNLTQESPQLAKLPTTPPIAPSLDTIVEAKPGPQIPLEKPADGNPLEEVHLTAEALENTQASIVNNIVVLRSIAQKQTSEQIDESRLLKPVRQRHQTRQQMQRAARGGSQRTHEQLDMPAPPTINVTIGRVEVRASAPAKRAESARAAGPKLSLDEYLRGRSKEPK